MGRRTILLPTLLFSICALALSQGGKTAQDCTIGNKWTEKYIRFECYKGTGDVVKGVRAIGCVPNNTDSVITPGKTYDEKLFTYSCSKSGDVVSYQIINCRDNVGKAMAVNETRKLADGATWKCYKDEKGEIKLLQEIPPACDVDGVKYAVGKIWTKPLEFKVKVGGVEKVIGKAVRMECVSSGGVYVGKVMGCVTAAGTAMNSGITWSENKINFKCLVINGTATMTVVEDNLVNCDYNGTVVKNGEKYTTKDGINIYTCAYGKLTKITCMINGKPYGADRLISQNGKLFYCNFGDGYVNFGGVAGCPMPDGSIKQFYGTKVNGTEVHRCYFSIKGTVVTAYWGFWGCHFYGKAIGKYKLAVHGNEVKKCGLNNGIYSMRELTALEMEAYLKVKPFYGSSLIFGGEGGSGSGEDLFGQPTKPADDTPNIQQTAPPLLPGDNEACISHHTKDKETGKCKWTGPTKACAQLINFYNVTSFVEMPNFPKETFFEKRLDIPLDPTADFAVKVIVRQGCMFFGYKHPRNPNPEQEAVSLSHRTYGEHRIPCSLTGDFTDYTEGLSRAQCFCDPTEATVNNHVPAPPPGKQCVEQHFFNENTQSCESKWESKFCGELITHDGRRKMLEIPNWPINKRYDVDHYAEQKADNFHETVSEIIVRQHCWATLYWRNHDERRTLNTTGYGKHKVASFYNKQLGTPEEGTHRIVCECIG